jgi:hypothetical protein
VTEGRPGSWGEQAREVINRVIDDAQRDGVVEVTAVMRLISKAYPFGERAHYPYQAWLEEVKLAEARLRGATPGVRVEQTLEVKPGLRPVDPDVKAWLDRQGAMETERRPPTKRRSRTRDS